MKRRAIKSDEQDVVSGWRRVICSYQRAGATSRIKRRMRRRERREGRQEARSER